MEERDDWRLTEALHHAQGRGDPFAAAVRATRMPMIITDPKQPDNPIVFANEAFQKLSGYGREEVLGRNCRFLQGPETDPDAVARIRAAVHAGEDISIDILNYRKDGSTFWNALFLSAVRSDAGEIQFFFASQLDITSRIDAHSRLARQRDKVEQEVRKRTQDLEAALAAKTLLLHEVDHRVKNNMTMIGSILRLQLRNVEDEGGAGHLRDTMQRIDAIGSVHRRLYQSDDVTLFAIGAYAANLAGDMAQGCGRRVRILTDLRSAEIPAGQAAALGLVVNEILMGLFGNLSDNADEGVIRITARSEKGKVVLQLEDQFIGPEDRQNGRSEFSQALIERLASQANAVMSQDRSLAGSRVTMTIGAQG